METRTKDEIMMARCIQLASAGIGFVAPNPLVGSVIVYDNKIIGEGYHRKFGGNHAEVEAINSVQDKSLLNKSTLYVNLEPCNHFGKTPPCSDLILKHNIPEVVIGCVDTYHEVSGAGIRKLESAGVNVGIGVLEKECRDLNRRFFTYHHHKRPYIILKWAQSIDGKTDFSRNSVEQQRAIISCEASMRLLHKWRTEESAIMVGTNTAVLDNPSLTSRLWGGNHPTRVIIDWDLRIPKHYQIFDNSTPTLIFNSKHSVKSGNTEYILIEEKENLKEQILSHLYNQQIQSVIIEGGSQTIESFISKGLWDEARVIVSPRFIGSGMPAPQLDFYNAQKEMADVDSVYTLYNHTN